MRPARLVLLCGLCSSVARALGPTATDWQSSLADLPYTAAGDVKATCPSSVTGNLNAVHGRGRPNVPGATSGEVWAVGDTGTIIYYNGVGPWVTQASGTTANLRAVYIYPSDVTVGGAKIAGWACGDGGTLLMLTDLGGGTGPYSWSCANCPAGACLAGQGGPLHICADMLGFFAADPTSPTTHLFITGAAMCGCNPGPTGPDPGPCPPFGANPLLLDLDTTTITWKPVKTGTAPYDLNTVTWPSAYNCNLGRSYCGLISSDAGPASAPANAGFALDSSWYRFHMNLTGATWNQPSGSQVQEPACNPSPPYPAYFAAAKIGAYTLVVGDTDPGAPDSPYISAYVAPATKIAANVFLYDQFASPDIYALRTGISVSTSSWGNLHAMDWLEAWGFGVALGGSNPSGTGYSGPTPDAYFALITAPDSQKVFYQDDATSMNTILYQQKPSGASWPQINGVFLAKYNEGWAVGNQDGGTGHGAILHWTGPTASAAVLAVSLSRTETGPLPPNSTVDIVMTVTNTGGTGVINFNAVLPAPAQASLASGPSCSTIFACPTSLAPGGSVSFTWTFSTTACVTGVTFLGTATGKDVYFGSITSGSASLSFGTAGVGLSATLMQNRVLPPPNPGIVPAQYEIMVTNTGTGMITGVDVVDTVPPIINPVSMVFQTPAGLLAPVATASAAGTIVAWTTTATLAPGQTFTFTITGQVFSACQTQTMSNVAWAAVSDICFASAQMLTPPTSFSLTGPLSAAMAINRATEQIPGRFLLELVMTVSNTGNNTCLQPLTPIPSLTVVPSGPQTVLQTSPFSGTCDAFDSLATSPCSPWPCSQSFTWTYLNTAASQVNFIGTVTATVITGSCTGNSCMVGGNQCMATATVSVTFFSDSGDPGMITLNRNLFRPHGLNQKLTVSFNVKDNGDVSLIVYNSIGQRIKTLFKGSAARRIQYDFDWDGTNDAGERVSSGAYFVRLESSHYVVTKKVALIK